MPRLTPLKSRVIGVTGLIIGVIFLLLLYFYFSVFGPLGDLPDYIMVKTIKRYPNSIEYRTGGGDWAFPDGEIQPGSITFKTNDSVDEIFSFYKQLLEDRQWSLVDENNLVTVGGEKTKDRYMTYTKNINNVKFEFDATYWDERKTISISIATNPIAKRNSVEALKASVSYFFNNVGFY